MPEHFFNSANRDEERSPTENVIAIDSASAFTLMREKHAGVAELSRRWGYSPDIIRRWFLEKPRPGVLRHSERKRGKREYISLRISESAAAAVYAEKCGVDVGYEDRS